jgi:hypothetical protein
VLEDFGLNKSDALLNQKVATLPTPKLTDGHKTEPNSSSQSISLISILMLSSFFEMLAFLEVSLPNYVSIYTVLQGRRHPHPRITGKNPHFKKRRKLANARITNQQLKEFEQT